ncbi:MAG: putative lipase atg15 [Stictis urceolatum]|nr:putative lipase atg15 [Stictis urceolata]
MHFDQSRRQTATSAGHFATRLAVSLLTLGSPVAGSWAGWGPIDQARFIPYEPQTSKSYSKPHDEGISFPEDQRFTLRHVFHRGTSLYPDLHRRLDISPDKIKEMEVMDKPDDSGIGPYDTIASPVLIHRLKYRSADFMNPLMSAAQVYSMRPTFEDSDWTLDEVPTPNITDKKTVVNFALMAASAYNRDKTDPDWEDARSPYNLSSDIGWEKDGIRGHVFSDMTNSTIVISIKGTTSAVFDGAETTTNDKENDNLFASCCCGQGGSYMYRQVCNCMTSAYSCNDTCVTKALRKPNRYYQASLELYGNITEMYPDANVWLTGHSLGGLVASLVGLTYGQPALTYEAVPQAMAAERLSLPVPPGYSSITEARKHAGIYNFGHTADPVYMGACNGATALCTLGGYALESQCHAGLRCVYDTADDRKWRMALSSHSIRACIKDVYRSYDTVPQCVPDDECVDCFNWKRYQSNGSDTTTTSTASSSSTTSSTRTSTCKTPGWWGCRDETSTTSHTTTTSTTATITTTTETCKSYGWFGNCLDPITTSTTVTTTIPVATTTAGAHNPATGTCETPGFFWGCKDKTTSATSHAITPAPEFGDL